jgi:hypothetical protein
MDEREIGQRIPVDVVMDNMPKELVGGEDGLKDMLAPIEHVLIASSVPNPDVPGEILGTDDILSRGPSFYLKFPPHEDSDLDSKIKEQRGGVSYRDGTPGIFDPTLELAQLSQAGFGFRINFPPVNPKEGIPPSAKYEIQLTRVIANGTKPDGMPQVRHEVVQDGSLSPQVEALIGGVRLHKKFEATFGMTPQTNNNGNIRSFEVSMKQPKQQ